MVTALIGDPSTPFSLGTIRDDAPHSLSVTHRNGEVTAYLDGQRTVHQVGLQPLVVADTPPSISGDGIHGQLLCASLFDGQQTSEEAASSHKALRTSWDHRPVIQRINVRARPITRSRIPQAAEILPYRSALVVSAYRVVGGTAAVAHGSRIFVAQWALMDGKSIELPAAPNDEEIELTLESLADHPELESVYLEDTLDHPAHDQIYVETDR